MEIPKSDYAKVISVRHSRTGQDKTQTEVPMSRNTETIIKFYKAFQDKNPQSMIECYSDDIEFYDPAFQNLKGITI